MNRMSVSNRSVSVLPSGFLAVPVPCTSATPTTPLKSVIVDGSIPGPKKVVWNVTPPGGLGVKVAVVGLGGGTENDPADAAAGHNSPLPSEAPAAAAAVPPVKARRENPCRARCDDSEPGATGHPLLSMPDACMVTTPKAELDPANTLTPTSSTRTEPGEAFIHLTQRWSTGGRAGARVAGLADGEHAVAAPDQLPDHRRSGQLPGHQQPARGLRVREQQQVVLAHRPRVGVRAHPLQVSPGPAWHVPGPRRGPGAVDERHRRVVEDRGDPAGPGQLEQ